MDATIVRRGRDARSRKVPYAGRPRESISQISQGRRKEALSKRAPGAATNNVAVGLAARVWIPVAKDLVRVYCLRESWWQGTVAARALETSRRGEEWP